MGGIVAYDLTMLGGILATEKIFLSSVFDD
jgi:hypothetical protein